MRAEMPGPAGAKQAVVFDATRQVMWMINYDKKTYTEMTKADADRLGGQMQDALAQVQAQMANLPPAQRAQIEAMMRGRGVPGMTTRAVKTEYKKTGTDKVGQWTCDKYEGFQNNQKVADLCTVDPAALGFAITDFEVSRQLGEFFKKMMPQNADQMFTIGKVEDQGFSGVPVRRTFTVAGRQTTTELSEATRQTFGDALFAVPAGFQKEDFLGGAAGGTGRGR